MSLFPFIKNSNENKSKSTLPIYREIAWDFENNIPIIENGNFRTIEGNEAIKVWCYKAISTSRFEHQVYSWNYGCEMKSLLGNKYTKELIKTEMKRYIVEALKINPYIVDVDVIDTDFNDSILSASIKIKTIYNEEVSVNV